MPCSTGALKLLTIEDAVILQTLIDLQTVPERANLLDQVKIDENSLEQLRRCCHKAT